MQFWLLNAKILRSNASDVVFGFRVRKWIISKWCKLCYFLLYASGALAVG